MSFIMTPSGREGMKKYGWSDLSNSMTAGIELVGGEFHVSYVRHPLRNLIHQLLEPAPGASIYVYEPLPPRCVRVLRRVKSALEADDLRMVFDFVVCRLDDASLPHPRYAAISYCWGDLPADSHLVLSDGSYLPITAKAAQILARIAVDTDHLWLDAVCINQADVTEKALQIPLMANIYRSASSVEVWLGKGEGIPRVLSPSAQNPSTSPNARFIIDYESDRGNPFSPYQPGKVVDLIWSPWFERAWIVQEFCFGKKHRYHFGDVELHPLFFEMILKDLKSSRFADDDKGQCQMPLPPMVRNFQRIRQLRSFLFPDASDKKEQEGLPRRACRLEDVLCDFYGLKATDPRDKVFAMLNFVDGGARHDIKPDYTRHAADVYHDAMESVFFRGTTFRLLGFAGLAASRPLFSDRPNTSSWVPDLSTPSGHSVWSAESYLRFKPAALLPAGQVVKAKCYHFFPEITVSILENTTSPLNYEHQKAFIVLHGKLIATVADVLPGDPSQNMAHLPRFLCSAMARTPSAGAVLPKTLIAENPDCLGADPCGKGFDQLCDLLLPAGKNLHSDPARPDPISSSALWKEAAPEARAYLQTMLLEGTGSTRGLFWTQSTTPTSDYDKHLSDNGVPEEKDDKSTACSVGLAANGVEPGDEVWLFVGARVPFILRRCPFTLPEGGMASSSPNDKTSDSAGKKKDMSPPSYFLVCEAYVHGIMHAEVDILGENEPVLVF